MEHLLRDDNGNPSGVGFCPGPETIKLRLRRLSIT
jgi:hypothetical protein